MGAFGRLFAVPRRCTDIDTAGRGVLHGEVFKAASHTDSVAVAHPPKLAS